MNKSEAKKEQLTIFKPASKKEALEIALDRVAPKKIAKALGITPQAIYRWSHVPAVHVLTVEKLSGVSRHHLRPDVFGEGRW